MKKIVMGFLSLTLIFTSIGFADDSTLVKSDELTVQTRYLTLTDAIGLATDNSDTLTNLNSDIEAQEIELHRANGQVDSVDSGSYSTADGYVNIYLTKEYQVDAEEQTLTDLHREVENEGVAIKIDVTKDYMSLQSLTTQIKEAEDNYALLVKQYGEIEKKHELGLITKLELEQNALTLQQQQLSIDKLIQQKEIEMIQFNVKLGLDIYTNLILPTSITMDETMAYNLNELSNAIDENHQAVVEAEEALRLAKLKYKVVEKYTDKMAGALGRPSYYQETVDAYDDAIVALSDAKESEQINLRTEYYTLMNDFYGLKISELQLEQKKTTLDNNKLKFELGLITLNDYQDSYLTYVSAYTALNRSKSDFYVSKQSFESYIHWIKDVDIDFEVYE